jgi:hypothetical protein
MKFKQILLFLFVGLIKLSALSVTCTVSGVVTASSSTCSSLVGGDTMLITGTLNLDSNYTIHQNNDIIVIIDSGSIVWNGNFRVAFGAGGSVYIVNGGALVNGTGSCNATKVLRFGTIDVASCNGGGGLNSFADFNSAGGGDISGPLPISLLTFEARKNLQGILLTWSTANEYNNAFFEIQRSEDGITFVTVGRVAGKLNSNSISHYKWNDTSNLRGIVYYRLKQLDVSGAFSFSDAQQVNLKGSQEIDFAAVYPNPSSEDINLEIRIEHSSQVNIVLLDLFGKKLLDRTLYVDQGQSFKYLLSMDVHPPGVYVVKVKVNGRVQNIKVEKI